MAAASALGMPFCLTTADTGIQVPGMGHAISQFAMVAHNAGVVGNGNTLTAVAWSGGGEDESAGLKTPHAAPTTAVAEIATFHPTTHICDVVARDGMLAVGSTDGLVWVGDLAPAADGVTAALSGDTTGLPSALGLSTSGWSNVGKCSAGACSTWVSAARSADGGLHLVAGHSGSQQVTLLGPPREGAESLTPTFTTGMLGSVTTVACVPEGALGDAPMLVGGTADGVYLFDPRVAPSAETGCARPAGSGVPSAGTVVHCVWGAGGGLTTLSSAGYVEVWDPRVWRVVGSTRAPCKYSVARMAASGDSRTAWVAGSDNDVLAVSVPTQAAAVGGPSPGKKARKGGAGDGREVNVGGYTGPVGEGGVDNTPARIKAGRATGFRGGARWVGFDVWTGEGEATAAGLTEGGVVYSVGQAQLMAEVE